MADKGFGVEPLQVTVGTSALLDKLIITLVQKKLLTREECNQFLREAMEDLKSSPDDQIRRGADFLQQMYQKQ